MKKLAVEVQGKTKRWEFMFDGDTKYLDEWRADGLVVDEVCNTIPLWVQRNRFTVPWVFIQDVLYGWYWDAVKRRVRRWLSGKEQPHA